MPRCRKGIVQVPLQRCHRFACLQVCEASYRVITHHCYQAIIAGTRGCKVDCPIELQPTAYPMLLATISASCFQLIMFMKIQAGTALFFQSTIQQDVGAICLVHHAKRYWCNAVPALRSAPLWKVHLMVDAYPSKCYRVLTSKHSNNTQPLTLGKPLRQACGVMPFAACCDSSWHIHMAMHLQPHTAVGYRDPPPPPLVRPNSRESHCPVSHVPLTCMDKR